MTVKAGYATLLLHVTDVERSLHFYALLGFEAVDVERVEGRMEWARVHCEGGAIMFLREEEAGGPHRDRFLLSLYTPDLPALRAQLAAAGVEVGPIAYPDYMPSGELSLKDPDDYVIFINQWGRHEHDSWEEERKQRLGNEARTVPQDSGSGTGQSGGA
ncbi:MAG: VOC family protein [Rubricoccaceae bacterium]|nr:VOC family protein [Rubricoccaceae bacterium]